MADAAMTPLPRGASMDLELPTGGMDALKYAAQAEMFQDDPNFYTWLEDWIGKGDDESIMIDAFNTLTDFGKQFEFQQQQIGQQQQGQQRRQEELRPEAFLSDYYASNGEADLPQQPLKQVLEQMPGMTSSCASLASHRSSQPSDDTSLIIMNSPADSSFGTSSAPRSSCTMSPFSFPSYSAANQAGGGATGSSTAPAMGPANSSAVADNAGPFAASSFTMPLIHSLGAYSIPAELRRLLGQPADRDACGSFSALSAGCIPSHGTVTSYTGTPPPTVRDPFLTPPASTKAPDSSAPAPGAGFTGGPQSQLNMPSLEQLIVRAICGNEVDSVGGAGLGRVASAAAPVDGRLSNLGIAVLGASRAANDDLPTISNNGTGADGSSSALTSCFIRGSSGSFGEGAQDNAMRSMDEESPSGSGRLNSLDLPTQRNQQQLQYQQQCHPPLRSLSTVLAGTPAAGARHQGMRRKSSSSGIHAAGHGHGPGHGSSHHLHHHHLLHGLHVPQVHVHVHSCKAAVATFGLGGYRGTGGLNAGGKPTRSARTKAVFAALEAEVSGKLSELEALQRENATLAQRVEILEVAVERQSAVLNLMTAATAAERASACTANAAVSPADGRAAALSALLPQVLARSGNIAPTHGASNMEGVEVAAPGAAAGGGVPVAGSELLEWARKCTVETYVAWYKEHMQEVSLALLALEDAAPNPEAEMRLVKLVASAWVRTSLVCIFQPLTQLRLKGLNLETNTYSEPSEQHWMEVIKFMTVSPQQVAEMENLFHSYNLLHGSFRAELQDTQCELAQLVEAQDSISRQHCSKMGLTFAMQQIALLKRVRSILQKTHLLYSSTIGVAAMRILKPKEFAKCTVQSYPYHPCGPSLMRACWQLRTMKAIWGASAGGCTC